MKPGTMVTLSYMLTMCLLPLVSGSGCRSGTGFLPNKIMHDLNNARFPSYTATGEFADTNTALGQSHDVTFTSTFDIWSHSGKTKMRIFDDGHVGFEQDAPTLQADTGDPKNTYIDVNMDYLSEAFAAPHWITATTQQAKFTARRLKRSRDMYNGPHMCDINRVESEIERCNELQYDTLEVDEMVLITWEIRDAAGTTILDNFQMILAVTNTSDTYILFIYDTYTTTGMGKGIINGFYSIDSAKQYAGICNYNVDLSTKSNCKCGGNGVFVFKTTNAANTHCVRENRCATGTAAGQQAPVYDSANRNTSCMDAIAAQPVCDVEVYCMEDRAVPGKINITFYLLKPKFDMVTFLVYNVTKDYTTFDALNVGGGCTVPVNHNDPHLRISKSIPTTPVICGMAVDTAAKTVGYALYNYDGADTYNIIREAGIVAHGICTYSELPLSISITQRQHDMSSTSIPILARTVTFGFQDRRTIAGANQYADSANVNLGQDLYVYACFNRMSPWQQHVDPYGLYVHTCTMANNADFTDNAATNLYVWRVIDPNGCNNDQTKVDNNSTMAFWFADTFKVDAAQINDPYCQVAGPMNAAHWSLPVGNKKIWIRCYVNYCTNRAVTASSRCADSCGNTIVDRTARKRRSINDRTDVLEASIIINNPESVTDGDESANTGAADTCINTTVATSLSATIIILLLAAAGVAAFLFFKLQKKMNKKM